jgi:CheY-like chemotaxis protein
VVLDYEMPGMKGDQLAMELKQREARVPILMLTAYGEMLRSPGRPLKGVDLIVDKPFRLEHLREGIAKVIALHANPKP